GLAEHVGRRALRHARRLGHVLEPDARFTLPRHCPSNSFASYPLLAEFLYRFKFRLTRPRIGPILNRFNAFPYRHFESIQRRLRMIPASYLFKDIYRQHWEEPEAPAAIETRRFPDGLLRPLARAVSALLARQGK